MERNGKWENGKMEMERNGKWENGKMEKMGKWENGAEWGMSSRRVHSPPTAEHTLVPEDRRARQSSASQSNKIFCRPDTSVLCRRDDVGHFCGDLSNLLSRRVVGRAISCLRWQQCSQTQIPGDFTPQITITLSTDNFVRQTLFGRKHVE